ncbi:glycoside hydrolase family 20 zincin-like fold domain-containing protein [Niabella ginsengisoli]|uniref:Glycoside hydrolase family 20 zincin-like fold domain-containing protein n=1 Tax=Niabella ginsengisoli TaxID=522298 RepID=A0ABS9SMJ4_9BACT|nr:glycoside hydrolase family 20 zincin-like fold domain-containing protein [Niabella ginsengisoli]MCH5599603.1 glycoside hydrolase family 20 zincin-like fold domain-containing protein [Niabella ginsengisoli]
MNCRLAFFLGIIISQLNTNAQQVCPIIPQPLKAALVSQTFVLNKNTAVAISHDSLASVALYLQQQLLIQTKIPLIIQKRSTLPSIKLSISKKGRKADAYTLSMNNKEVHISGETTKGVFYGIVSFYN